MKNKYYTPEIEEFHEGFKYEQYNKHQDEWDKEVWDVISEFGDSKLYHLDIEECRVKCLDQEDIESLGFELSIRESYYESGDYQIYYWPEEHRCEIYAQDVQRVFKGTIKNKSELKRVLKMIGYDFDVPFNEDLGVDFEKK